MITVDISNVWGHLSLPDLLNIEREIAAAHMTLADGVGPGKEFLGWMDLPADKATAETRRIQAAADKIRSESDICVVVGIGGSYLGPRAAIELLQGANRNLTQKTQILYAGNTLSTRAFQELTKMLEGKDFSLIVISKSGTTTEPAIAFRNLRWLLERRYGPERAKRRIYAITDPHRGALRQMAKEEGWETFSIPANVGGRFSVLSPVGLLPMAVAGIDIHKVLQGAYEAKEHYDNLRSLENPVWLYAGLRNLLYRNGMAIELLTSFEPDFRFFGMWWQQLFGESEGKDGQGLFPAYAEFTADLHSLGQMIQEGKHNLFETMIRFDPPRQGLMVGQDVKNLDGLNYLAGQKLDHVDEMAYQGTLQAHVDGDVSVISMDVGELNEAKVGELFYFFELSCGVSAYILGVNPFDQPGVEQYKRNMFRLLGKPNH